MNVDWRFLTLTWGTKFQFVRIVVIRFGEGTSLQRTAEVSRAKWIRVMALRFKLMPRLMTLIGFRDREKGENAKGKIL